MSGIGPNPGAGQIVGGSTLPATPTPRQVFVVPGTGMYVCITAGSWSLLDSSTAGEVTGSGTTNRITKWTNGAGSAIGDSLLIDNGTALTYTGAGGVSALMLTGQGLTSGRVAIVGASGVLTDDAGLTYNAGTDTLTTTTFVGALTGNASTASAVAVGGITGLGTGVATALAVNVDSAGAFVVNGGALGTPSSATLTSATGLPVSTGISGLGANVATALAVAIGSAGAPVLNGGALGSPSSAGTMPAFTLGGTVTSNGQSFSGTIANLGSVTTVDINGGTIDATVIGGTGPAAGSFTTVGASGNISTSAGNHLAGNTGGFLSTGGESGIVVRTAGNLDFYNGSAIRMIIGTTGAITLTSGITDASGTPGSLCYNTSTFAMLKNNALTCTVSSRLFKKGIRSFKDGALPIINKLRPVRFAYKDQEDRERLGFIAEELAKVDIRLADNFTSSGRAMSIDQNAILGLVVEAIQELFTQNQVLNARLETLHARG